jgi:LysM repeat protein
MKRMALLALILVLGMSAGLAVAAPSDQEADGEVYVVQKDDWLSKIADKYYGDPKAYPTIVEATNAKAAEDDSFAVIDNPDLIFVGQKLWIPSAEPAAQPGESPTLVALRNATYQGIYDEPVQLTDGQYAGQPFVEGGASRPTVTLSDPFVAFGDLNGDGVEDAAVILAENSGGSGVFVYLAAVVDQNGVPVNQATRLLGDRVQINTLLIDNGEIVLDMVTQGPDDPFCCPTLEVTLHFRLEADQLAETTDFAGTYEATLPSASSPGRDITLTLSPDGTVERSTDYLNDEAPIVEIGTWEAHADGTATVTLTGRPDGLVYENPDIITFILVNGELIAVDYDLNIYGSEGLQLTKQ